MKVIIEDWICGIGKNLKKCVVSMVTFTLFLIVLGNFLLYISNEKNDPYIQNEKGDYIYCSLYRTDADSSNYRISERPFFVEGMKSALIKLRNTKKFRYISIDEESYAIIDTDTLKNHFNEGNYYDFLSGAPYRGYYSENPQDIENIELENEKEARRLMACKMDQNAIEHYKLEVVQGKLFEKEDYILNLNDKKISVLLGSNYQKYFNIGDKIDMRFYGIEVEAEVKGILKPYITIENDKTYEHLGEEKKLLDYSIVVPYWGIEGTVHGQDEENFMNVEYMNQLSGIMVFNRNKVTRKLVYDELRKINDVYLESDIFTVDTNITGSGFYFFQGEYSENMELMKILIFFFLIACILNIYLTMLSCIKSKLNIYSIQIMCGKSWKQICFENMAEVLLIIGISIMFVFFINIHWLYQNIFFYIELVLIIAFICLIIEYRLFYYFKTFDIEQMMRRNIE